MTSEELQKIRELAEARLSDASGAEVVAQVTILQLLDELERQEILASGYKTANEEAQELLNELHAENEQLKAAEAEYRGVLYEYKKLEKEADWLANHCREFCESYSYCGECPMFSGWLKRDKEDCGEAVGYRGEQHTANWREAARKAVKEKLDAD